jgi:oligoribonuclease NrnB/cAMP/cGMP phosphodiesterase (DHH superfamily)
MNPICIYHGGCDDGFAAALCVHLALKGQVTLFAAAYGKPIPEVTGMDVIIVDFSYKRSQMEYMADRAKSILMLDHHKSAMEDMAGFSRPNCNIVFDMNRSGAQMAWDHYGKFGGVGCEFIAYIQDRDLWRKQYPFSDEFTAGLRSYPQDLDLWEKFFREGPAQVIEEGKTVQRYYRQLVDQAKDIAYNARLADYTVPVCNSSFALASDVAGELSEGYPFAAVFYETDEGYVYSLRSRQGGIDVSKIALQFGGGGHAQASGFKSKTLVHTRLGEP